MPRYIDAEKLRKQANSYLPKDLGVALLVEIDEAPSADVTPVVHGRWIQGMRPDLDWVRYVLACSCCKYEIRGFGGTNYCSNCGAKMDAD